MTEGQSRRERLAAADLARAEAKFGMHYWPDNRPPVEQIAAEAHARGDTVFQIDLPISAYQGAVDVTTAISKVWRPEYYDYIGLIERQGWRLDHMSAAYVPRGSTHQGVLGGATVEGIHGDLVGVYLFRRV